MPPSNASCSMRNDSPGSAGRGSAIVCLAAKVPSTVSSRQTWLRSPGRGHDRLAQRARPEPLRDARTVHIASFTARPAADPVEHQPHGVARP
jgi:hypothetical protein